MDHLLHLAVDTRRFIDALREVPPDAPVPACVDWNAADLAWHLTDVQWAWGRVVAEGLQERPRGGLTRPDDLDATLDQLTEVHERLQEALRDADPDAPCWSWIDAPTTVTWAQRRMAHEALVHRLDAEATAGTPTSTVDAKVALDGIDELFQTYVLGIPAWGSFNADGPVVQLQPVGGHEPWTLQLGRMTGQPPDADTAYDLPAALDAPTGTPDCTLRGAAAPLHAWLWGRGPRDALRVEGQTDAVDALDALLRDVTG